MQLNPHPSSLPLWVLGATWGGNYALLVRRFCRTQCNTFGAYAFSYILLKPKNLKFNRNWGPEDPLNCYSWVMCSLYSLYIDVRKLEGNSELWIAYGRSVHRGGGTMPCDWGCATTNMGFSLTASALYKMIFKIVLPLYIKPTQSNKEANLKRWWK